MREVEVVLDHPEPYPVYGPGERIRGHVVLEVSRQTNVRKTQISLGWHTTGRGDTAQGSIRQLDLPGQTYEPGRHRIPFEFRMPSQGPPSYEGQLIHVQWHVKASVDLPWAKDPTHMATFRSAQNRAWIDPAHGTNIVRKHLDLSRGWTKIVLATVLVFFALCSVVLAFEVDEELLGFLCAGVILLGLALYFGYVGGHRLLSTRLVKNAKLHPDSWPALLGDTFRYHFEFDAGIKMQVTKVRMTLRCTERATYTRGTDTVTETRTLFEETITAGLYDKTFAKKEHAHYTGQWQLGTHFPPTISLYRNSVDWVVEVSMDIPNWPDWKEDVALLIDRPSTEKPIFTDELAPLF